MAMHQYFIGLMSGTSTDGVDGVVCKISSPEDLEFLGHAYITFSDSLRERILKLNTPSFDEINSMHLVGMELIKAYEQCVQKLLTEHNLQAEQIRAIGAHGQTVRHNPKIGLTLQINNPALLAEKTHIDVVSDFRNADIAAGGEGAPLVPAFHKYFFKSKIPVAILNLGGFANISIIEENSVVGFDIGPCNALMDLWIQMHKGQTFDKEGKWGGSGHCHNGLLNKLYAHPFFSLLPPKSTGRDDFNINWLNENLTNFKDIEPVDIMATLRELTVHSILECTAKLDSNIKSIYVCGGGVFNKALMDGLNQNSDRQFVSVDEMGINPMTVEALAFAWLAYLNVNRISLDLKEITRAQRPKILGSLYPY